MLSRMGYEMRVAVIKFNSSLFVFNFGRCAYVCVCVCACACILPRAGHYANWMPCPINVTKLWDAGALVLQKRLVD